MINIDRSKDFRLSPIALTTLRDRYLKENEQPQEAFARAALEYCGGDLQLAQRIYDYASKGWFMFSTPILSNAGTGRGLPISCFLNYVDDSREGITAHYTENAWLSSMGGGIGGYWGDVRSDGESTSKGSKSTGAIPFIKVVDSQVLAFSQGETRRGSYAAYLDISHPEIEEFINIRKPTGGDMNRKSLNLHHGVVISDAFMYAVEQGSDWDLISIKTQEKVKTIPARQLWESILNTRIETGEPYIMWGDTVNKELPSVMKQNNLKVHQSNLCSEIVLPTNEDRTAVCCLSSLNLEYYDEWKDTSIVRDLVRYLDNVLTYFIEHAPPPLSRAVYSAQRSRDIGLGAMGFHSFLQKKGVPFESVVAKSWNKQIFKHIKQEAVLETKQLAKERGACPDSDIGIRNMHLLAIAPNASSSIICGCSPSIEPIRANIFTQKTLSGTFEIKNKQLDMLLLDYCDSNNLGLMEYDRIWKSIVEHKGSVQHLDFLDENTKLVYKTASEIDQRWIIEHAGDRQEYICQAQSVNLFFSPNKDGTIDAQEIHDVHMSAWRKGLKTLYYVRSEAARRVENISVKVERNHIIDPNTDSPVYEQTTCLSCEG